MSLMDTTDGADVEGLQLGVRQSAAQDLLFITTTSLSIMVARVIGTIELAGAGRRLDLQGGVFDFVAGLDFGLLGYLIVGLFLVAWDCRLLTGNGRIEERYGSPSVMHSHVHAHDGVAHSHKHIHP
jgi:high-affinity nickel-transport protein